MANLSSLPPDLRPKRKPVKPKPTVKKSVVKPPAPPRKTGMAGLYGGLGPQAYVNNLYAPQEQLVAQQQAARQANYRSLINDFLNSLTSVGSQLQPYENAATQQSADARNAAASLLASNPNAVTQADLAAINAPQAQRAQVQGINDASFGGNAALLQYAGGAIPADQFRQDAAGRAAYLGALPAIGENLAVRGLSGLNNLASQENLKLQSAKAGALQNAQVDLANYVQKKQAAQIAAQKTAFDQNLAVAKYKTGVQQFNARQSLSYKRLAQQAYQSDRSYGLSLANLGIRTKSLQLRAIADEKKYKSGGFTPSQLNRFQTDASFVATQVQEAKARPTYQDAMAEMAKRHVPLSIATAHLNKIYPITQRPITAQTSAFYDKLTGVTSGPNPADIVSFAQSFLGVPYKWGGNSPKTGLDCSAFIQQVFKRVGINLPRTTYLQVKYGQPVTLQELQPGDAIFTRPGKSGPNHVGLYIGNGQVQESPKTGDVNKIIPLSAYLSDGFVAARRYVGA